MIRRFPSVVIFSRVLRVISSRSKTGRSITSAKLFPTGVSVFCMDDVMTYVVVFVNHHSPGRAVGAVHRFASDSRRRDRGCTPPCRPSAVSFRSNDDAEAADRRDAEDGG